MTTKKNSKPQKRKYNVGIVVSLATTKNANIN